MDTYIYTEVRDIRKRAGGHAVVIKVYRMKSNVPSFVAQGKYNTARWKGATSSAHNLIAKAEGRKISDYFYLDAKNVRVIGIE